MDSILESDKIMDQIANINQCNDPQQMNKRLCQSSAQSRNDETVMYIIVNSDLKMGKGKIAGQSCHSACRMTRIIENLEKHSDIYDIWVLNFEPKIVLRATQKQMEEWINLYNIKDIETTQRDIWCVYTRDIGRTQIEQGSLTTICFHPILRVDTPEFIRNLKLV